MELSTTVVLCKSNQIFRNQPTNKRNFIEFSNINYNRRSTAKQAAKMYLNIWLCKEHHKFKAQCKQLRKRILWIQLSVHRESVSFVSYFEICVRITFTGCVINRIKPRGFVWTTQQNVLLELDQVSSCFTELLWHRCYLDFVFGSSRLKLKFLK